MFNSTDIRVPVALIGLSAIAGLALATPCQAENFNGVYVGGDFGYESSGRTSKSGWTYGGFAGVDVRLGGGLVPGAEVRLADSAIIERLRGETPSFNTTQSSIVGRSIGATARLGWLADDKTLLFARGGIEQTRFSIEQVRTPKPPTSNPIPQVNSFSVTEDSAILGAGVERYVTNKISVRLTYDWAEKFDRHQLRAGVAFRF